MTSLVVSWSVTLLLLFTVTDLNGLESSSNETSSHFINATSPMAENVTSLQFENVTSSQFDNFTSSSSVEIVTEPSIIETEIQTLNVTEESDSSLVNNDFSLVTVTPNNILSNSSVSDEKKDTSDVAQSTVTNDEVTEVPRLRPTWFVLLLEANCSALVSSGQSSFRNQVRLAMLSWLFSSIDEVFQLEVSHLRCVGEDGIHVNFSLSIAPYLLSNLSQRLDELEALKGPLLRYQQQDVYVTQIHLWDGLFLNKEPEVELKHTDVELVIYIAVGSSCAFLFGLAALLLLYKYCCSAQHKESPHPTNIANRNNLRLEDYTLTRIPRPKFGYIDYCQRSGGLGVKRYSPLDERMCTGLVQASDTSVVPLEDVQPSRNLRDGVLMRATDVTSGWDVGGWRSSDCLHQDKSLSEERGLDNPNFR